MQVVDVAGVGFPLYTARPGHTDEPVGVVAGMPMDRRAPNNVLWFVEPLAALPGWRPVGGRPRWTLAGVPGDEAMWQRNSRAVQRMGERRWWGPRHHVRIWDQEGHAVGQAHYERWAGRLRRRHEVLSLNVGRDAVAAAATAAGCAVSFVEVPSEGIDWDGRVAVIRSGDQPK